jgi:long-chain acyl-CoA synthetase
MGYQSLAEMFLLQAERYRDRVLYRFARGGQWEDCTWQEALRRVQEIALGLVSLGVKKGDRVAIFSANRVEWSLIDWANICIGALTVPIYSSSTANQLSHILSHSGSTMLFVEYPERIQKANRLDPSLALLRKIILIESVGKSIPSSIEPTKVISLDKLQEMGRRYRETDKEAFERLAYSLRAEDDLTIIYTSGTTGEPKGVLTTHAHYLFMIDAVESTISFTDEDINLQFLPLAHSFGRLEHFVIVAKGFTCAFARSLETIAKDLQVIRPTLLFSVPRIYENAYARIRSRVAASGALHKLLFHYGLAIGQRYSRYQREGKKVSRFVRLGYSLVHRLIFSKIHTSFGGRLRLAISGGAPLAPRIAEFFHSVGILILEGYGLTESSTVSHVNRPDRYKFGSVGLPLKGVECRIAPDGEILLCGPNVFKGYYREPKATQEVIDSGSWFHTGDIGEIDGGGFLHITDRKKDLIVTSGGKKVAPQMIENLLKTDPLISQVIVVGDRQAHLMALITLNQDQIREWGRHEGLEFSSPEELTSHPRVASLVKERIRHKNKQLAAFEAIRSFRILSHEFSVEKEELTPTLKLRRQVVMEHYKDLIDEMVRKPRFDL